MNSMLLTDGYKLHHHIHYPEDLITVFSNFTPRTNKYAPKVCQELDGVLVAGVRFAFTSLIEHFNNNFFFTKERSELSDNVWAKGELLKLKNKALKPLKKVLDAYTNGDYDISHFEKLWDLGHLPINVRALDEGTICPIGVPMLTIWNTGGKDFAWVPNFLETILSLKLWKMMTSATIALAYRKVIEGYNKETDPANLAGTQWQCHDFSMRGMDDENAAAISGVGHLFSFTGTDCLPALFAAEKYYGPTTYIGGGVPATEHSVASSYYHEAPTQVEEQWDEEKEEWVPVRYF